MLKSAQVTGVRWKSLRRGKVVWTYGSDLLSKSPQLGSARLFRCRSTKGRAPTFAGLAGTRPVEVLRLGCLRNIEPARGGPVVPNRTRRTDELSDAHKGIATKRGKRQAVRRSRGHPAYRMAEVRRIAQSITRQRWKPRSVSRKQGIVRPDGCPVATARFGQSPGTFDPKAKTTRQIGKVRRRRKSGPIRAHQAPGRRLASGLATDSGSTLLGPHRTRRARPRSQPIGNDRRKPVSGRRGGSQRSC